MLTCTSEFSDDIFYFCFNADEQALQFGNYSTMLQKEKALYSPLKSSPSTPQINVSSMSIRTEKKQEHLSTFSKKKYDLVYHSCFTVKAAAVVLHVYFYSTLVNSPIFFETQLQIR